MADLIALDLIERKAAAFEFEAEQAASAPLPGEPQPIDPADELREMLVLGRDWVAPMLPYIPHIYTDEVLAELSKKTVPVLDKWGVSLDGVGDLLGPELKLAALVIPLAIITYKTHKAWRQAELESRTVEARSTDVPAPAPMPDVPPVRTLVPVQDTGGQLRSMGA